MCEISQKGIDYCSDRGLSDATIAAFRLAESPCGKYIAIPIYSESGDMLFWAGRRIAPGGHVGRYVYYGKVDRSVVFGLNLVERSVTHAVLVEGFFDVMLAYERGYRNFVANIGSATTSQSWWSAKHDAIVSRFKRVTVAFDGCYDGGHPQQKAAVASFVQAGLTCDEVVLPPGSDPASISKEDMFKYFGKPA